MKNRKFAIAVDFTIATVKHYMNGVCITSRFDLIGLLSVEEAKKDIERKYRLGEIIGVDIKSDVRFYEITEKDLVKYGKKLERNCQWANHIS